ncbi:MAG TPA: peroxiredoxin [Bdellovibrionales bacterium]|nr:peroxiredoxin [Bdellovibrionales bacterium]
MKKKKTVKKTAQKKTARATVGKVVPGFSAPSTGDKTFDLNEHQGRKIVLYFYPKDSTPGCTLEGKDFSRLLKQFRAAGSEVLGVSRDSMKSHEKFKSAQDYTVDLLSDQDEKLCALFDVIKMKNMYGRQVRGIERSTFVIDAEGILKKEWRGVKVAGHAQEVLDYVRSL